MMKCTMKWWNDETLEGLSKSVKHTKWSSALAYDEMNTKWPSALAYDEMNIHVKWGE